MLTGPEIKRQRELGNIHISDFRPEHVGPNSYDVRLADTLLTYDLCDQWSDFDRSKPRYLDMTMDNPTVEHKIGPNGLILEPGRVYLGATMESVTSKAFVPCYDGRSSLGRLGVASHITAGFGDVGFAYEHIQQGEVVVSNPTGAVWTLEITVIHPVRVYAGRRVGQVFFYPVEGDIQYYMGKYNRQFGPQASLVAEDRENIRA